MHERGDSRAFRADITLSREDGFAVTRGEKVLDPVELRWAAGRSEPSDIVRTTLATPVIISDRVVDLFEQLGFRGWRTYPVELLGKDGKRIPGYQGLAVTGRCGSIDNSRSVPFKKIMPGGVFTWWRGLYFDAGSWDGSDLFMPSDNVGWIFCAGAVREALLKAKATNVVFTPLDEVERMTV